MVVQKKRLWCNVRFVAMKIASAASLARNMLVVQSVLLCAQRILEQDMTNFPLTS